MPSKTAFVAYWPSLIILSKSCLTCSPLATVENVTVKGFQLIAAVTCLIIMKTSGNLNPQLIDIPKVI